MGSAMVVFSNGSKRMAHNLDDSRLRWQERRTWMYEMDRDGIAIPVVDAGSALTTISISELRKQYGAQCHALDEELARIKELGTDYVPAQKREALKSARNVIGKQLTMLRKLGKTNRIVSESSWIEAQKVVTEEVIEKERIRQARLTSKDRAFADYLLDENRQLLAELRRLKSLHEATGAVDAVNIPQSRGFIYNDNYEDAS